MKKMIYFILFSMLLGIVLTRSDWVSPPSGGGGGDTYNNYYNVSGGNSTAQMVEAINKTQGMYNISVNCSNIIFNGGTKGSTSICDGVDAEGSGSSSNGIVYPAIVPLVFRQANDISNTDSVNWVNTDMSMQLYAGNTYNLNCDIMFTGAAAGTGQAINLTNTATVSNPYIMYKTWSSATAPVGFSTNVFNTVLTGTGSGAAVIMPNKIIADFAAVSSGNMTLRIRSEVNTSATTVIRGSQCQLYNVSGLRSTAIKNATGNYPAQQRLNVNMTTVNNTVFQSSTFGFNLSSGKRYTLICDILFRGQAATTGQVIALNMTAGYSDAYMQYLTWSTATAPVGFSTSTFNTALTGTGSGALVIMPNYIWADFTTTSGGSLNISYRSEVISSFTTMMKGSMCLLYDNNGA